MKKIKKIETIHGVFDSAAEARRYAELVLLEKAGTISGLLRQVEFDLVVNGELIGRYTPDFVYKMNDEMVAEEYKGRWSEASRLRARLFMALYKDAYRYHVTGCGWRKVRRDKGRKRGSLKFRKR